MGQEKGEDVQELELNRRKMLQTMFTAVGSSVALSSCTHQAALVQPSQELAFYTPDEFTGLSDLADLIIPDTDSPGAVAAGVPSFMDGLMAQWASAVTQSQHRENLTRVLDEVTGSLAQKEARLIALDTRAFSSRQTEPGYRAIKQLIVNAYFTSEVGATQERPWVPVPGRWDPAVEIKGVTHA